MKRALVIAKENKQAIASMDERVSAVQKSTAPCRICKKTSKHYSLTWQESSRGE